MNDRYLYRAKRIDNGEWVIGYLIADEQNKEKCFIGYVFGTNDDGTPHDFDVAAVDPSTICQCTGLRDKNGKLIWEHDIVKVHDDEEPCLIEWGEDTARWNMTQYGSCIYDFDNYWSYEVEVIGSAIDNPELLEVGE